jgi:hypothetical protein
MRKYTIQVTASQVETISLACEILARLGICQIDDALDELPMIDPVDWSEWHALKDELRANIRKHCDANLGIRKGRDRHKSAWDIYQVLRHRLAWDRLKDEGKDKPDFYGVSYSEPFKASEEPLAEIKEKP